MRASSSALRPALLARLALLQPSRAAMAPRAAAAASPRRAAAAAAAAAPMSRAMLGSAGQALARAQPARRSVHAASTAVKEVVTVKVTEDYDELVKKLKDISTLEGLSGLLGWDEQVMMPEGAAESRAAQKSVLAGVVHDKRTDKALGSLIDRLSAPEAQKGLDAVQQAVVRDAGRDYKKATAIPKDLAQRMAELESQAYQAWVEARKESDFSKFAPYLKEWVEILKRKASLIDPSLPPYDVLLDDYERGMSAERIKQVLDQVKSRLVPLIRDLKSRGVRPPTEVLGGEWDVERQAAMCKEIAVDLGFDLKKGRLDVSVHPFTGGAHPTDVRMTTRFKGTDFIEGLTGAVHETGHALYEQGRNSAWFGLPVSSALSMGVHESQSLLWERMVALSPEFCEYLVPKLAKYFPSRVSDMAQAAGGEAALGGALYGAINTLMDPSMIRVESDEVTYPLHIILRFEIEKGLIEGTIHVDEVPALWNKKMAELLGCTPSKDAEGCLQDVHWSCGAMGYFPTYTLGAIMACQIFRAAGDAIPDLRAQIARGEFGPLRVWLNENIHKHGSFYPSADELLTVATGRPTDPSAFLDYLEAKYTKLYKMN